MAYINGETSNFPHVVDKLARVTPYTGATPGSWGDFITPQYVNHVADCVYNLIEELDNTSSVSITPLLKVDGEVATTATGSLHIVRFCVRLDNLRLRSVVYSEIPGTIISSQSACYRVVPLPTPFRDELGLVNSPLTIENSIQYVEVHARPITPVNSLWSNPNMEIYPYAMVSNNDIHLAFLTATPEIYMDLGNAYVSFEVGIVK